MGDINRFSRIANDVLAQFEATRERLSKDRPVKFGEERLSARDARARFARMSREEKVAQVHAMGEDAAFDLLDTEGAEDA